MRPSLVTIASIAAFALAATASAQQAEHQHPHPQQEAQQQPQQAQQQPQQQQPERQQQAQHHQPQQQQGQQQQGQQQQGQQQQGQQEAQAQPYQADVEELAEQNDDFRRVLHTGSNVQLVVMSIDPGEDIGAEAHPVEQCLYIVEGNGRAEVGGQTAQLSSGSMVCVPGGSQHNIINTGNEPLKLFTVYSPPEHAPNTVHATREDAQAQQEQPA